MSTIEFVNTVGFDDTGSAIMVDFSYDAINATTGETTETVITVPFLTIVPIPYIRVRCLLRALFLYTLTHPRCFRCRLTR